MKIVLQRVTRASVSVEGKVIAAINKGLLILFGAEKVDSDDKIDFLAEKTLNLRIFPDENGKMNLSILDTKGSLMVISQFTLCGDIRKGRRPSFINAENPNRGIEIYEYMVSQFRDKGIDTVTGKFGEMMDIDLINQGPATFIIDSKKL